MAIPDIDDFSDLHERVLRFMGAFSSTQFAIDGVIGLYLQRRMPDLGTALQSQFLRKIRDDQRLPLFKGFAAEACYEGDLRHFEPIYLRAKQVRDLIGHYLGVVGPVYSTEKQPFGLFDFMRAISMMSGLLRPAGCGCSGSVCGGRSSVGFGIRRRRV
jgi:hypothetical protein